MRLWIIFSRILLGTERREMGLNDDGVSLVVEDGFGIGTTLACFHDCGKCPFEIVRLNKLAKDGAMVLATAFSIRADIPSGPVALVTSRLLNNVCTSSVLQKSDSLLAFDGMSEVCSISGGRELFQQLAK